MLLRLPNELKVQVMLTLDIASVLRLRLVHSQLYVVIDGSLEAGLGQALVRNRIADHALAALLMPRPAHLSAWMYIAQLVAQHRKVEALVAALRGCLDHSPAADKTYPPDYAAQMLSAAYSWWLVLRRCSRQAAVCARHPPATDVKGCLQPLNSPRLLWMARYLREVFEAGQSGQLHIAAPFAHLLDTKLIDDLDPLVLFDLFFLSATPSPRLRALAPLRVSTELYSEIGDLLSERGIKYRSQEFDALFDLLLLKARRHAHGHPLDDDDDHHMLDLWT